MWARAGEDSLKQHEAKTDSLMGIHHHHHNHNQTTMKCEKHPRNQICNNQTSTNYSTTFHHFRWCDHCYNIWQILMQSILAARVATVSGWVCWVSLQMGRDLRRSCHVNLRDCLLMNAATEMMHTLKEKGLSSLIGME